MLNNKDFTLYLNRHEIEALVHGLAGTLNKDYEGKEVVLIGVLKGASIFMADLVRAVNFNPECDFVKLTSYGKGKSSTGTISFLKDISVDLHGKHVLIVEE